MATTADREMTPKERKHFRRILGKATLEMQAYIMDRGMTPAEFLAEGVDAMLSLSAWICWNSKVPRALFLEAANIAADQYDWEKSAGPTCTNGPAEGQTAE